MANTHPCRSLHPWLTLQRAWNRVGGCWMTEGGVLGATTPPLPLELLHPQGSAVGE